MEEIFNDYDRLADKMRDGIRDASKKYKDNKRLIALKDKFVDMNNVSNWIAEVVFDNPLADLYVDKVNTTLKARRAKKNDDIVI